MNILNQIHESWCKNNAGEFFSVDAIIRLAIDDFGLIYSLSIPLKYASESSPNDELVLYRFTINELTYILEELGVKGDWIAYFSSFQVRVQFKLLEDQFKALLRFDGSYT